MKKLILSLAVLCTLFAFSGRAMAQEEIDVNALVNAMAGGGGGKPAPSGGGGGRRSGGGAPRANAALPCPPDMNLDAQGCEVFWAKVAEIMKGKVNDPSEMPVIRKEFSDLFAEEAGTSYVIFGLIVLALFGICLGVAIVRTKAAAEVPLLKRQLKATAQIVDDYRKKVDDLEKRVP